MSLDGRTATAAGRLALDLGRESRELVHRWRAESDAIAVGIGTVLADDPLLTARDVDGARQPLRVVFDRQARLPLDSQLLRTLDVSPVLGGRRPRGGRRAPSATAGAEILVADGIAAALADLGRRGITSLFLEGGPTLAAAFAAAGEIDESRVFVAPVLLGGGERLDARLDAGRRGHADRDPVQGVVRMFTGLIQDVGTVEAVDGAATTARRLRIATRLGAEIAPGDSVAVDGVCLTATEADADGFAAEAMNQTLELDLARRPRAGRPGQPRARGQASDRLGGHILQGHVDGVGEVVSVEEDGFARRLRVAPRPRPAALRGRARLDRPRRRQPHGLRPRRGLARGLADPGDARADEAGRGRVGAPG